MTLTALIGALVALMPSVKRAPPDERLQLERRLADVNRDLAVQKLLAEHWRDEAKRMARLNRVDREHFERRLRSQRQEFELLRGREGMRDLQRQYAFLQQSQQLAQQASPMNAQQGQLSVYEGFCNCVPSRAQVWGSQNGLVQELNQGE